MKIRLKPAPVRNHLLLLVLSLLPLRFLEVPAQANPVGPSVAQGSASFTSQGSHLSVQTSDRAFINWQSFNIGLGETTSFIQPSSSSLVWNQIHDQNPSQILGNLNANGYVVLQNSAGFFIGGQASITAHGLLMTTAPIPMPDLSGSGAWSFNAPPPTASIINYGQINLSHGGSAFLLAHDVENHGTISSPGGEIGLYAGKQVLFSERPDGRGISANVTLPDGSVDNTGKLVADAGTIAMRAQVVNQGGLIQANSVREVNGTIELVASDSVNLGSSSVIQANGDAQGPSSGGSVTIKSDNAFTDQAGSRIQIAGGTQGGNGGQVELSASQMSAINSSINGQAVPGFTSGKLFIDPANILLTDHGDGAPASGKVNSGDPPSAGSPDTLTLNINTFNTLISQNALSQISLQATKNIELNTLWSLPDSQDPKASLTLSAGNKITLDDGSGLDAGRNWSINLSAGPPGLTAKPAGGTDGIYLNGTSYIQTQNGNIDLWAANEVLLNVNAITAVGSGIRTTDGGSINVIAELGNINTGANPQGYLYHPTAPYYTVSGTVGGASTVNGGDVTLTAPQGDITSYLPNGNAQSAAPDGGSGAFGPKAGNVTVTAGGNVYGHYVVADGVGVINAGQNAGAPAGHPFALSLIKGSWTVNAANIYLQEVRNPNGVFNNKGFGNALGRYLFGYDPQAAVNLNAVVGVYLTDLNVPRPFDQVPVIYPPTLNITAGSGGVVLGDTIALFPSAYSELNITTKNGGDLTTNPNGAVSTPPELLMSDSSQKRWLGPGTFGDSDHGNNLLELNNPNPVTINISGSMENITLLTTKATQITVGGDMINCGFSGQNLHPNDRTSISVAGQISYSSAYSFVFLPSAIPNLPATDLPPRTGNSWDSIFKLLVNPQEIANLAVPDTVLPSQLATFASQAALFPIFDIHQTGNPGFVYDPTTRRLGFGGQMSQSVLFDFTQPLTVLRYGSDGFPETVTTKDPVTGRSVTHFVTDTVSWANPSEITALFQASQGAPSPFTGELGLRLGGPGYFDVTANSMSLGNSWGIISAGVADPQGGFARYNNLASITKSGATLNVDVTGNLDMFTSTIAAIGGGDVNVSSSDGSMDLGSQELFATSRQVGFGIFTSGRGDVNVIAKGDININGSRIASYNGGDISVESLQGNVNVGSGGDTFTGVGVSYVDPKTGQAGLYSELVFGSGIVANTLVNPLQVPGSAASPGNITVSTPQGSIFASLGGIVQEALNGNVSAGPTITLTAGTTGPNGFKGNIDLGDSGVIGGTVIANANGNINGLVISRQNTTINAAQSFSGTVLSGGTANLSAGGTISGTVVGVGGISASSGQGISAALLGQNVSVGGGAAQSTLGTTATATAASQGAAAQASNDAKDKLTADTSDEDENKKKKGPAPVLVRKTGRVTVILPPNS